MMASELSLLGVALVGSLAYGGGDFIGGRASVRLSPVGVIVLAQCAALAVAAQAIPWPTRSLLTGSANAILVPGLIGGLAYAIALSALYAGIARGRAALVTPVFALVSILVPLLADLLLGRALSQTQIGGLLLCGAAIVLLAGIGADGTDRKTGLSVRLGVIGGLADGAADVALGILPTAQAYDALLLARAVMAGLALALYLGALTLRRPASATRPPRLTLLLPACLALGAGICDALGHVTYVRLATQGSVSVASALVGVLSAGVVILLAVLVLKERIHPRQLAGFATGAAGVTALAL